MIKPDMEALLGTILPDDDITIAFVKLLREGNKRDLLNYSNLCTDDKLKEALGRCTKLDDSVRKPDTNTVKNDSSGPSLARWISRRGGSMPL